VPVLPSKTAPRDSAAPINDEGARWKVSSPCRRSQSALPSLSPIATPYLLLQWCCFRAVGGGKVAVGVGRQPPSLPRAWQRAAMSKLRKLQAGEAPEAWWAALERQAGAPVPIFQPRCLAPRSPAEVDATIKKVNEGVTEWDALWDKLEETEVWRRVASRRVASPAAERPPAPPTPPHQIQHPYAALHGAGHEPEGQDHG
jgi:hypothetical protein